LTYVYLISIKPQPFFRRRYGIGGVPKSDKEQSFNPGRMIEKTIELTLEFGEIRGSLFLTNACMRTQQIAFVIAQHAIHLI